MLYIKTSCSFLGLFATCILAHSHYTSPESNEKGATFFKEELTRLNPMMVEPHKVKCGDKWCPHFNSVMRIIWEDKQYKSIPPRTTLNGFTYKLNSNLVCEMDGGKLMKDTCYVIIYPKLEFSIGKLFVIYFIIFCIISSLGPFINIINECCSSNKHYSKTSYRKQVNREDSYDTNTTTDVVNIAILGIGAALFSGMGDGDHNNEDYD